MGPDKIKLIPPQPGVCPLCAARHKANEPHDRDSFLYQNQFFRKSGRFPTWEDAMSHCDAETQAAFRADLERRSRT